MYIMQNVQVSGWECILISVVEFMTFCHIPSVEHCRYVYECVQDICTCTLCKNVQVFWFGEYSNLYNSCCRVHDLLLCL